MYQYRHCTKYNGNLYNGAWCPLCPRVTVNCNFVLNNSLQEFHNLIELLILKHTRCNLLLVML